MPKRDITVLRVIGVLDPEYGGPSESSVSACIASQRAGIQNTFAFPVAGDALGAVAPVRARLLDAGVRVHTFGLVPCAPHYGPRWGLSPSMAGWIATRTERHDVVHIHQTWGFVQVAALLAAARHQRPSVVTPHESLTSYDVGQKRSAPKQMLKRLYLRKASLIVLSSRLEARDSVPARHRAKSVVIPHPLADFEPRLRSTDILPPPARLVVGFLGRLHEKKNVDVLIRAIARSSPDARLRIAGDGGPERRRFLAKIAADAGIQDRVEWIGFLAREDRPAFLDSIDVLAMPSRYECFGMAAAEAMARGVPTIVASTTGIADLTTKYQCGRVVAPTVEAFSTVLREFDRDRGLLISLARRGLQAAAAELSMESYGDQIRRQYERLLAEGDGRRDQQTSTPTPSNAN